MKIEKIGLFCKIIPGGLRENICIKMKKYEKDVYKRQNPDYALPVYKIQLETGETTQLFQGDIPLHTVWPADGVSISLSLIHIWT